MIDIARFGRGWRRAAAIRAVAQVGELVRAKNTCGLAERSSVKNSDSDIGIPSSTFLSELTDGLTRFCSINENHAVRDPGALRELALREAVQHADRAQVRADIDIRFNHGCSISCTHLAGFRWILDPV
jgi:hypothetical protein